jgi:predicted DNA-binding transcriptional regulator AlpA
MKPITLISAAQLCEELGVSNSTFDRLAKTPGFPPRIKVSARAVRYSLADVREWIASRTQANAA